MIEHLFPYLDAPDLVPELVKGIFLDAAEFSCFPVLCQVDRAHVVPAAGEGRPEVVLAKVLDVIEQEVRHFDSCGGCGVFKLLFTL